MRSQNAGFFISVHPVRHFTSGKRTKQIAVVGRDKEDVFSSEQLLDVLKFPEVLLLCLQLNH
jgi:hypothetical protein